MPPTTIPTACACSPVLPWPVSFKRGGLTFYAVLWNVTDAWVVGEAPVGAEEPEKRDMARGLSRMVQDAVAVIPHGANVKLESAGQTQGALHEDFLARQDRAISKVLMGQTLTIETDGKNSLAATEAHKSVADDLADADKAMVTDAWNEIACCMPRSTPAGRLAPLAEYDEPEDLNVQADLGKKIREMGAKFTREYFTGRFGLKPEEFTLEDEAMPPMEGNADFSAPADRETLADKGAEGA